jgi:hypothetical protein
MHTPEPERTRDQASDGFTIVPRDTRNTMPTTLKADSTTPIHPIIKSKLVVSIMISSVLG